MAEVRRRGIEMIDRMSIGGVQNKVGAVLRAREGVFEIVRRESRYILKPSTPDWPDLPANEDLTMRLAALAGVEIPLHGLVWTEDRQLCYFVERFDRTARGEKLLVEDFAQILGFKRSDKYNGSMEQIGKAITTYCSFPIIDRVRLLRRTLVALLTGNDDMHLKNFSIITDRNGVVSLSPAYDLVNTAILLSNPEDLAIPLSGRKRGMTRRLLVDYFAGEKLGLNEETIASVFSEVAQARAGWSRLITRSFLSEELKERYRQLVDQRWERFGL
jgi:serine/threonine-protein kinase HipA